jgi:hypothetical protein
MKREIAREREKEGSSLGFGFCSGARDAGKWRGDRAAVSRPRAGGISFFTLRRPAATICFAAERASAKSGHYRSSWPTGARRKDDDGGRVVTMRLCRILLRSCENATSENPIFHRAQAFGMSLVTSRSGGPGLSGQIRGGFLPSRPDDVKT